MPANIGEALVVLILTGVVALIIRALWRGPKAGSCCTGECSSCRGCHGGRGPAKGKTPPHG